jgi:hypothetical protein
MVAADQVAVAHEAEREGCAAVRAEVLDRGDLAALSAIDTIFSPHIWRPSGLPAMSSEVQATYQAFLGNMLVSFLV